jgi:2-hydroxychromene-2-carboxylate isomerase
VADEDVKLEVKAATGDAIELGVFGVPTVQVGDELFWGDDHLEEAATAAR